jgi:hypothetical protein
MKAATSNITRPVNVFCCRSHRDTALLFLVQLEGSTFTKNLPFVTLRLSLGFASQSGSARRYIRLFLFFLFLLFFHVGGVDFHCGGLSQKFDVDDQHHFIFAALDDAAYSLKRTAGNLNRRTRNQFRTYFYYVTARQTLENPDRFQFPYQFLFGIRVNINLINYCVGVLQARKRIIIYPAEYIARKHRAGKIGFFSSVTVGFTDQRQIKWDIFRGAIPGQLFFLPRLGPYRCPKLFIFHFTILPDKFNRLRRDFFVSAQLKAKPDLFRQDLPDNYFFLSWCDLHRDKMY